MKILIEGYLDKNFGDDMMIGLLIEALCGNEVYLYCNDEEKTRYLKQYIYLNILPKESFERQLKRRFDAVITIGGSLFKVGTKKALLIQMKMLVKTLIYRCFRIRTVIIGCNVGPFNYLWGRTVVKWRLKLTGLVTARDKEAFAFVKKECGHKNCHFFPDVLFSFEELQQSNSESNLQYIGISVYRSFDFPDLNPIFCRKMAELINLYIERSGHIIRLFAFDSGRENDVESVGEIISLVKYRESIEKVIYNCDPQVVIDSFSQCRAIVAVRFHSAIMAVKLEIPFLPIIYSNKTENFLDDIGFSGERAYLNKLDEMNVVEAVELLINREKLAVSVEKEYTEAAFGHLKALKTYLFKR